MNQRYEITIRGHLTSRLETAFAGTQVYCLEDGNTHIISDRIDQSALYGLLMWLRDLGMTLVSVNRADSKFKPKPDENLCRGTFKEEL